MTNNPSAHSVTVPTRGATGAMSSQVRGRGNLPVARTLATTLMLPTWACEWHWKNSRGS
ncbi:unnamed protein product, partial [Tenebrio molitor]